MSELKEEEDFSGGEQLDEDLNLPSAGDEPSATEARKKHNDQIPGEPWVDYVPPLNHKTPETLEGRIDEHLSNLNQILANKEQLRIIGLEQQIHKSYKRLWTVSSNKTFKAAVRLKRRKAYHEELKTNPSAKEGKA